MVILEIENEFLPLSGGVIIGPAEISSNLVVYQSNPYTRLPGAIAYGNGAVAVGSEFNSNSIRIVKYISTDDLNFGRVVYNPLNEYVLSGDGLISSETIDVLDVVEGDIIEWNEDCGFIWRKYDNESTAGYAIEDISVEDLNSRLSIPESNKLYQMLDDGQLSSYRYGLSGMTMV